MSMSFTMGDISMTAQSRGLAMTHGNSTSGWNKSKVPLNELQPASGLRGMRLMNNNSTNLDNIETKPQISLVIFELNNVILTNASKYEFVTNVKILREVDNDTIALSMGGYDRVLSMKENFSKLNINKKSVVIDPGTPARTMTNRNKQHGQDEKDNNVMAFVSARDLNTKVAFGILKRMKLHSYFITKTEKMGGSRYLTHVIGNQHSLRNGLMYEYILILKLLYVLKVEHEKTLYIGHDKEVIDHLININACHTYHVQTKGVTNDDFEKIHKMYQFE